MAVIRYIAKRGLIAGHREGGIYSIAVDIQRSMASVNEVKSQDRSPGGAMESCLERIETKWQIDFAPVIGTRLDQLNELLQSIESGETWRIWLSDSDPAPLVLKCVGDAYGIKPFQRAGARAKDAWSGSISAVEVVPFDPTQTIQVDQVGQDLGGDSIDVYASSGGGSSDAGGLDPDPVVDLSFSFQISAADGFLLTNPHGYLSGSFGGLNSNSSPDYDVYALFTQDSTSPGPNQLNLVLKKVGGGTIDLSTFDDYRLTVALGTDLVLDVLNAESVGHLFGTDDIEIVWDDFGSHSIPTSGNIDASFDLIP